MPDIRAAVPKIVVHTDVLLDHLCGGTSPSILRVTMQKFLCYTTVFQAIEMFSLVRTERERTAVEHCLAAIKLLGLNARTAARYGSLVASSRSAERWNVLIAGLCLDSKLPLLTGRRGDFKGIKGLTIIAPKLVMKKRTGTEIVRALHERRTR